MLQCPKYYNIHKSVISPKILKKKKSYFYIFFIPQRTDI